MVNRKNLIFIASGVGAVLVIVLAYFLFKGKNQEASLVQPLIPEAYEKSNQNFKGLEYVTYYKILNQADDDFVLGWMKSQNEYSYHSIHRLPNFESVNQSIRTYSNFRRFEYAKRDGQYYIYSEIDPRNNQYKVFYSLVDNYNPVELLSTAELYPGGGYLFKKASVSVDAKWIAALLQNEKLSKAEILLFEMGGMKGKPVFKLQASLNSGISWNKDGLFYNAPTADKKDLNAVWLHTPNQKQSDDILVYSNPELSEFQKYPIFPADKSCLIINEFKKETSSQVKYALLNQNNKFEFRTLIPFGNYYYRFIEKINNRFLFFTNKDAPLNKVIEIEISGSGNNQRELVAQDSIELQRVTYNQGRLIALYANSMYGHIKLFDSTGTFIETGNVPEESTLQGFRGKAYDSDVLFVATTINSPNEILRFDPVKNRYSTIEKPRINFNPNNYTVQYLTLNSSGNYPISVLITHRKDVQLDGANPLFLWDSWQDENKSIPGFGYGKIDFIEKGGIIVNVNFLQSKQSEGNQLRKNIEQLRNFEKDLAYVIQYLIENKYTNSQKISAGASGLGALILANTVLKNPGLVKCLFFIDGLFDLTILSEDIPALSSLKEKFGAPADSSEFRLCINHSPLYLLNENSKLPPSYIEHRLYDDFVPASNSFRFTARLQKMNQNKGHILLYINNDNSLPTLNTDVALRAKRWSFVQHQLGMN